MGVLEMASQYILGCFILYLGYKGVQYLFFKSIRSLKDKTVIDSTRRENEFTPRKIEFDEKWHREYTEWEKWKKKVLNNFDSPLLRSKSLEWSKLESSQAEISRLNERYDKSAKELEVYKLKIKKQRDEFEKKPLHERESEVLESKCTELHTRWSENPFTSLFNLNCRFSTKDDLIGKSFTFHSDSPSTHKIVVFDYPERRVRYIGVQSGLVLSFPFAILFSSKNRYGRRFESMMKVNAAPLGSSIDLFFPHSFEITNVEVKTTLDGSKVYPVWAYQAFQDKLDSGEDSISLYKDFLFLKSLPGTPLHKKFKDIEPVVFIEIANVYGEERFLRTFHKYVVSLPYT